jgi:hypothetical protein
MLIISYKIKKEEIIINKNINKVKEDFIKLTAKDCREQEMSEYNKIFIGEVYDNIFRFEDKDQKSSVGLMITPELYGKMIEVDKNETLLKINVHINFGNSLKMIFNIILFTFMFYFLINFIINIEPWMSAGRIFGGIFGFLFYPILIISVYLYKLKNIFNDINIYNGEQNN